MEQGMIKNVSVNEDLGPLLELAGRVGRNPLLTQASTGNISLKLEGALWIKASGKWMADATGGKILIPLDLAGVRASIRQNLDPAELYPNASIETAMHVTLPHRGGSARSFRQHHRLGGSGRCGRSTGDAAGRLALAVDSVCGLGPAAGPGN